MRYLQYNIAEEEVETLLSQSDIKMEDGLDKLDVYFGVRCVDSKQFWLARTSKKNNVIISDFESNFKRGKRLRKTVQVYELNGLDASLYRLNFSSRGTVEDHRFIFKVTYPVPLMIVTSKEYLFNRSFVILESEHADRMVLDGTLLEDGLAKRPPGICYEYGTPRVELHTMEWYRNVLSGVAA